MHPCPKIKKQKKHQVTTPQHRRDLFATRVRVTKILWPRWKANELVSPTACAGWHQPDLWIWMRLEKDTKIPRGYVSIYWIPQNSQNLGIFPVFKRTAYQHIQYLVERTWKNCRFTSAVSQTSSRLGQNKKPIGCTMYLGLCGPFRHYMNCCLVAFNFQTQFASSPTIIPQPLNAN